MGSCTEGGVGARCTEGGGHLACGRPQSPQEGLWGPEEGPERRGRLHHARCRGRLAPRLHLARPTYLHSCPHSLAGAGLHGHSRDKRHRVKPNNLISCYTCLLYLPWRAYHGAGATLHGCLRAAAGGAQAVTTPLVHFYPYPSSYSYSRVVPPRLSLACSPPPPPWPPRARAGGALARMQARLARGDGTLAGGACVICGPPRMWSPHGLPAICPCACWVVVRLVGSGHGAAHAPRGAHVGRFSSRVLFQTVLKPRARVG